MALRAGHTEQRARLGATFPAAKEELTSEMNVSRMVSTGGLVQAL